MSEQTELDPASAEYQLVARIIGAVSDTVGRPNWWNGRIVVEPGTDDVGRVWPDGTVELQRDATLAPITRALAGDRLDERGLATVVNAFTTAVHEGAHLVHRDGDEREGHQVDAPDAIALNEGLIERWTHEHVDDVLHRAGVDRIVPEVIGQQLHDAYPAYTKATQALVEGVATMTGRVPAELELELMVTERAQRWNKLVDVVVEHEFGGEATEVERNRLATAVRLQFGLCQVIHQSTQYDGAAKQEHGARTGRQTVTRLADELTDIREARADEQAAEVTAVDRDPNRFADFLSGHSSVVPGFARPGPTTSPAEPAKLPQPATLPPPPQPTELPPPEPAAAEVATPAAEVGREAPGGAHAGQGARSPVAARIGAMLRRSHRGGIHRG